MRPSHLSLLVVGLMLSACQQSTPAPAVVEAPKPGAAAVVPAAVAQPAQTPAQGAAVSTPDKTPKLTRNADGTLRLEFTDRWGKPFDATYENEEFFKRAVPVIHRSMTDEQVAHLENQLSARR
jgi:hypothetical protein